ncbi:hypothetical protein P7C73_g1371, partial [Tremellales sp. Uapishka_1]
MKWTVLLSALPAAVALTPAARWGQQAIYVDSLKAMYVIGGETAATETQITNEVLVLPLNTSGPAFVEGPATNLPPHAFAAAGLTHDESSIVVVGGMTAACSSDDLSHTLDLAAGTWTGVTPSSVVRRRGSQMAWVDNGSTDGAMMVVGGMADKYACSSSSAAYTAGDVLSLPLTTASLISSRSLPSSLTGDNLAVAGYAMASINGTAYLLGGQSSSGVLADFSTVGVWSSSTGWVAQTVSGDVPAGRVGASLVAHPTMDLLILHGGSALINNTQTPTALLAFLNTTSWEWSTPSNLQPPASSSRSYHSSVITSQGVMITSFGLSTSGSPRSDVLYLDMRDLTTAGWTWKSYWNANMLNAVAATSATAGSASATGVVATTNTDSKSAPSSKKITTIIVPIMVILLLASPVIIYLIRRRVRVIRKRRLARHFSFSSQEDSGDFASPNAQFMAARRKNTQYTFGRDGNERDGNIFTDMASSVVGILKRNSRSSSGSIADGAREMSQVDRSSKGSKFSSKQKWEEIDFGLGKVDERGRSMDSRRSSFSATGNNRTPPLLSFPMPVAATQGYDDSQMYTALADEDQHGPLIVTLQDSDSPRVGSPRSDGQIPLIPSFTVLPPSVPPTPAAHGLSSYPALTPIQTEGLDWSALANELETKPAFRSISPSSTLRSHAHQVQNQSSSPSSSPKQGSTPPRLPSFEFHRSPSPTISLVNSKTGRRVSETLPFTPRSVSQPMAGRQLAGAGLGRRESAPLSPASTGSATPTQRRLSHEPSTRRASNPSPLLSHQFTQSRRGSAQSKLRVVNVDQDEEQDASGMALTQFHSVLIALYSMPPFIHLPRVHNPPPAPYSDHIYKTVPVSLPVRIFPATSTSSNPSPWLLYVHGGSFINGRHFLPNSWVVPGFRTEGYNVVSLSYRMLPHVAIEEMLVDLKDGFEWCRSHLGTIVGKSHIDIDTYVVGGESAGGAFALILANLLEPKPKAVIDNYGVSDFSDPFFFQTPSVPMVYSPDFSHAEIEAYVRNAKNESQSARFAGPYEYELSLPVDELQKRWGVDWVPSQEDRMIIEVRKYFTNHVLYMNVLFNMEGKDKDDPEFVEKMRNKSALHFPINGVFPPTYILHGLQDDSVPIEQSRKVAERLRGLGVDVKEVYVEGMAHGFEAFWEDPDEKNRTQWIVPCLDFVRKHVRDTRAESP